MQCNTMSSSVRVGVLLVACGAVLLVVGQEEILFCVGGRVSGLGEALSAPPKSTDKNSFGRPTGDFSFPQYSIPPGKP